MRHRAIVLAVLASVTSSSIAACRRDASESRDSVPTDSVPTADTPSAGRGGTTGATNVTCGVDGRTVLTGDGIGSLRTGAAIADVTRNCRILRDTTGLGIEGQSERTILVDLGRDSVTAVVADDKVWRVHVRAPTFRTADSLGVGTPVSALRGRRPQILMGEGRVFLRLPTHCGLSFRLRGVVAGRASSLAQIADSVVVDEVLAVGC